VEGATFDLGDDVYVRVNNRHHFQDRLSLCIFSCC
jgi:hypothetical protein